MSFIQAGQWSVRDAAGRRKYISTAERARFLFAADGFGARERALCHVLAYTGCRVSEALELTVERIDADAGVLVFRTLKRRKLHYRAVPVPMALIANLLDLPAQADGRIFVMHRATAYRHVKRAMMLAQVRGPMTCPRGLRHGFGIRCAAEKVPPNLIQRLLGHSSITTTAIYLDAVGDEEREFVARTWKEVSPA
jgi:integrase